MGTSKRGLLLGALAALFTASAGSRVLEQQPGGCQYLPNTYLTTGLSLNRYPDVATVDACCQTCQDNNCDLFAWCPSNATDGCFTGGTSPFFETAGACTLYSMSDGWRPNLEQRGPQTPWISGHPTSKTLPAIPDAQPGICAPHNNTMLAGTYIQGSVEPSVDACCDRCSNNPNCTTWSYCPAAPGEKCVILSGSQDGETCNLYSTQPGQPAEVVQQGPETTWISGYRDPAAQFPVPEVNTTAPEGCNVANDIMLTSADSLGGWYDVPDAETCCTRCRNTPTCAVWAFCPAEGGTSCPTSHGPESPAACLLYAAQSVEDILVDQNSANSTWVSGVKWLSDEASPF